MRYPQPFMLLLSTSSLRGYGLHKIFSLTKEAHYDGISLDLNPLDFDTENALYIVELSKEFSMPVVSITAYERRITPKIVDRIIEMAKTLGSKMVNFYPPHRLDKDGEWFSEYLPLVQKRNKDLHITIINVEPKTFLFLNIRLLQTGRKHEDLQDHYLSLLPTTKKRKKFSSLKEYERTGLQNL